MKYILYLFAIFILCNIIIIKRASFEENNLKLSIYNIFNKKIKTKMRLFFFSDLHEKNYISNNKIIFDYINKESPSLILIGGDMIITNKRIENANDNKIETTCLLLKKINEDYPNTKVIYALGNHEERLDFFYSKSDIIKNQYDTLYSEINKNNTLLLKNSYIDINNEIRVYAITLGKGAFRNGLNDSNRDKILSKELLNEKIGKLDKNKYNILLLHSPDYIKQVEYLGFELILCGHLHGGMVRIPFIGAALGPNFQILPKYSRGHYKHLNSDLIVSAGMGTHTIKIRLNNLPEICEVNLNGNN
ncbi:MAG: metallophosphoesterase [Eubacteriales bacterium]|nr:metallophosphoesterase [Eubacteriales bacterium]